ncbi:MAG TPA: hypothetical protein VFX70_18415 [Mycobacteriales bacterium]|nr:hypothetical protein [Mycobacteriales bacterium]
MSGPSPYPRPALVEPTTEHQLAVFGRWVLALHQPRPAEPGYRPYWCTCGSPLVLCPYRSAATRYLGPPGA